MATLREILGLPQAYHHYYGDLVRGCFMLIGTIMIITLPLFSTYIPVPVAVSVLAILVLTVVAGFTNPVQRSTIIINFLMAMVGSVVFIYFAVKAFDGPSQLFLIINEIVAVLFIVALYYGTKSFRGYLLRQKETDNHDAS